MAMAKISKFILLMIRNFLTLRTFPFEAILITFRAHLQLLVDSLWQPPPWQAFYPGKLSQRQDFTPARFPPRQGFYPGELKPTSFHASKLSVPTWFPRRQGLHPGKVSTPASSIQSAKAEWLARPSDMCLVPRATFPCRFGLKCIVSNFCIWTRIEMIYIRKSIVSTRRRQLV